MSSAKVSIRLKYKPGDFGEVTIATDKGVKPAYSATGWFAPSKDFPELSVDIPSSQAQLIILEKDAHKGLAGLYVNFDRASEKFPVQLVLSFSNGQPGVDNTTANLTTERPKIDGPLERCPKFTALGYAVWN